MKKTILLLLGPLSAVLLSSCTLFSSREITVSQTSSSGQREYFRNEVINLDGISLESYNFLCGNLLMADLKKDPDTVLARLEDFFRLTRDPQFLLIAADLCRYLAIDAEPDTAIQFHLSCFYYCCRAKDVLQASGAKVDYAPLTQLGFHYNEACCGIFSYLKRCGILRADSITLRGRNGVRFVLEAPVCHLSVPVESVTDVSLCASYQVSNLMQINRRPGIGIPLVCRVSAWKSSPHLRVPPGMTIPVTLVIQPVRRKEAEWGLRLIFQDTCLAENFPAPGGKSWNLALDFSTPLACFLNDLVQRNLISVMLNAQETEEKSGLYMVEPYQPGKIPVVFVHGLMSSPETWVQMINSLKNNALIRKNYQFWFYCYSSGAPVMVSAGKLHKTLLALQKELCTTPEATEKFNHMVLVGHSMGGLITRIMLQKEPHYLMEKLLQTPLAEIRAKLTKEDQELLDRYLYLAGLPFVHRAVFMAVPHRGARMAQSPLAHLGAFLIKMPVFLLTKKSDIQRICRILRPERKLLDPVYNEFYTGIENLDPDSVFTRAIQDSPMKDDLMYHCIIGNKGKAGVPGGSDGIVPYSSSHLDHAASEIVIDSDHSVHRRPAAIRELLRILLLHLRETGTVKK